MLAWYVTFVSACDMKESQLLSKQQVSPTLERRPLDGNLDIMRSSATLALAGREPQVIKSEKPQMAVPAAAASLVHGAGPAARPGQNVNFVEHVAASSRSSAAELLLLLHLLLPVMCHSGSAGASGCTSGCHASPRCIDAAAATADQAAIACSELTAAPEQHVQHSQQSCQLLLLPAGSGWLLRLVLRLLILTTVDGVV
jgi:hypothetical protein